MLVNEVRVSRVRESSKALWEKDFDEKPAINNNNMQHELINLDLIFLFSRA
jgi:hypothetical protein